MKLMKRLHRGLVLSMCLSCLGIGSPVFAQADTPKITAKSAIVVDSLNGQVLYEQEADTTVEIAELTQLLSVYMVYKAIDNGTIQLDTIVPISDKAYAISQDYDIANVPLRQDFDYTVQELIEAVGVTGATGATLALAEKIAGSEEAFVQQMQQQLTQWGIEDHTLLKAIGVTTEYDPTDSESITRGKQNKLSARAVAKVAFQLAKEYPDYLEFTKLTEQRFKADTDDPFEMSNPNQLLLGKAYAYEGAEGLAEGTSSIDGSSLVAAINKNDTRIIAVVLGTPKYAESYTDTKQILDYVYASYKLQTIVHGGEHVTQIGQLYTANAEQLFAPVVYEDNVQLVVPMIDTAPRYEYAFLPQEKLFDENGRLVAPLGKGTPVGQIQIGVQGYTLKFLDASTAHQAQVVLGADLVEAPWYTLAWRTVESTTSDVWEATRKFFTDIFN